MNNCGGLRHGSMTTPMSGCALQKPTISMIRVISSPATGCCCRRWRILMKLAELSGTYYDFYAPSFVVRISGADLMRDHVVAVSQVEVDLKLGTASLFSFTITDCYSHKLHRFLTG